MPLTQTAEILQRALSKRPLSNSLKFDCGADGVLILDGADVRREDGPADCTIGITADNLDKLLKGKLNPLTGFAMGKLKVSGDMTVAMGLAKLLG